MTLHSDYPHGTRVPPRPRNYKPKPLKAVRHKRQSTEKAICEPASQQLPSAPSPLQLMTPIELAKRWKVGTKTLGIARSSGNLIPFYKIGNRVRYSVADVEAYEASNRFISTSKRAGGGLG